MKEHLIKGLTKGIKSLEFYFVVLMIYLEVVFHFIRFGQTGIYLPYKILFATFYGFVFGTVASILPKLASKIITWVFTVFLCAYFIIQVIYSGVFRTYLSVSGSIKMAGQALDFTDVIGKELATEWWIILLFLMPLVALFFLQKKMEFDRHIWKTYIISVAGSALIFGVIMLAFTFEKGQTYTAKEVYLNYSSVDMSVSKLGVIETLYIDLKAGIKESLGINNQKVTFVVEETTSDVTVNITVDDTTELSATETDGAEEYIEEVVVDTSPNILDIDFQEMIAEESNSNIISLHEYISTVTPTKKNEYTGMFEGYNLIFVTAEAFSGYVIDPKLTPTLYKMSTEGFVFSNYYTPLWYGSTLGGEYANLTGLMPKNGGYLSMSKCGYNHNNMMFTLGRQLEREGYKVTGFHIHIMTGKNPILIWVMSGLV